MSELQSADPNLADPLDSAFFTALQIDHLCLLLPQAQVAATESAANLRPNIFPHQHSLGLIPHAGYSWPIYCLDYNLVLTIDPPEQRQHCVLLTHGQERIGILCDQIMTIAHGELTISPVPKCMRTDQLLFHSLAVYEDSMVYISSTEQLGRLIHATVD